MPFKKKIYQTHTCKPDLTWFTYTHIEFLSILFSLYFYPLSLFLPLCFSLPYPPLSKDSQGCLNFGCCSHILFIQLINSSCPSVLSFGLLPTLFLLLLLFLPHPVLFIHHNGGQHNLMESWTDSRHDSVWPGYSDLPILI